MLPSTRVSMECTVDGGLIVDQLKVDSCLIQWVLSIGTSASTGSVCIHVYGYTCYTVTVTVYSLLHLLIDTFVAIAGTDIAAAPQLESERILKQQKDTQVQ